MKIWKSFSADHSSRLKIVGDFKTITDLNSFTEQFSDFITEVNGDEYYDPLKQLDNELFKKHNYFEGLLTQNDARESTYFSEHDIEKKNNNKVLIQTNDFEIGFIIKLIINNGGKVEILSYHDYPEEYKKTELL